MPRAVDGWKTCSKCGERKPVSEFCKQSDKSDGLETACTLCSRERRRKYKADNREKVLADLREYNKTPKAIETKERYRKSPRGRVTALKAIHKRHCTLRNATHDFTYDDFEFLLAFQENKCGNCQREFSETLKPEIDHVLPVCKGGTTTLKNVQLLCRSCNAKKNRKEIRYIPEVYTISYV